MAKALKTVTYDNPETGETVSKQSLVDMKFSYTSGYMFYKQKNCIRTFLDNPLPSELTWAEKGRIEALKHYILTDNQFLVYRSNNVIKPITVKELVRILDMSERQCKILIKKLKQYGVIKEVEIGGVIYFSFNPIYGFKDTRINLTVFLMFQSELTKILPQWVINNFTQQAKELDSKIKIIK